MDYSSWGMEYLREAETLKNHTAALRRELKGLTGEDEILMYRRISMMYTMYLECLHTGRFLLERGKRNEPEQSLEPGTNGDEACRAGRRTGT